MEIWAPIVLDKYRHLYEVSNMGRIRSLDQIVTDRNGRVRRQAGRVLKPTVSSNGYWVVQLRNNGKQKSISAHRLIAATFLGLDLNDRSVEVNHKDGNKQNNAISNFELTTHTGNVQHTYHSTGINKWRKIYTDELIEEVRRRYDTGAYSIRGLAREMNLKHQTVGKWVNRRSRVKSP